jgi:hypothetical protein
MSSLGIPRRIPAATPDGRSLADTDSGAVNSLRRCVSTDPAIENHAMPTIVSIIE